MPRATFSALEEQHNCGGYTVAPGYQCIYPTLACNHFDEDLMFRTLLHPESIRIEFHHLAPIPNRSPDGREVDFAVAIERRRQK